ncbi:Ger(x)C family spore germination protein [Paenibacillus sp. YIM B09110]|uniref:Ger(x)C family spore germination protein n=1 Tax=Paenibacillus sp. YIM B09110 TaxID=3126102 RepID=UPI00301B8DF7
MFKRAILLTALIALCLPALTGCWNSREPKELAIVMALGIDKAENDKYKITFQIANSGVVAPGVVAGGSSFAVPIMVYSGTGNSIYEAIRKTSRKVPRQLFFAHIRLIVIGESLAKQGIEELFDFFDRSRETRLTSMVLISRDVDASQIVQTLTPMEKLPANSIIGTMGFTSKLWSNSITVYIDDLIRMLVSEERTLLVSGIRLVGQVEAAQKRENVEQVKPKAIITIQGMAVFEKGKLKEWIDGKLARGVIWTRNEMKSSVMLVAAGDKKEAISIEVARGNTKVKARLVQGKPVFHVNIWAEGFITENESELDLNKPEALDTLEQEWATAIKAEVETAVKHMQTDKLDVLKFSNVMKRAYPKKWLEGLKEDWNDTFASSEVQVTVHTELRNQGLRGKSYINSIKK